MTKYSFLIVDNNPQSLKHTYDTLKQHPFVKSIHTALNAKKALSLYQNLKPDIILTDTEMSEEDGFWLAEQISEANTQVVFLSNSNHFATQAFEVLALHYILKPLTFEKIDYVIERLNLQLNMCPIRKKLKQFPDMMKLRNQVKPIKQIFINTAHDINVVKIEDIVYVKADGSYTQFYMKDKTKSSSSRTLKSYMPTLSTHPDFKRIHRSYAINRSFLLRVIKKKNSFQFVFKTGHSITLKSFDKELLHSI